jgi:hypothetical protein
VVKKVLGVGKKVLENSPLDLLRPPDRAPMCQKHGAGNLDIWSYLIIN